MAKNYEPECGWAKANEQFAKDAVFLIRELEIDGDKHDAFIRLLLMGQRALLQCLQDKPNKK